MVDRSLLFCSKRIRSNDCQGHDPLSQMIRILSSLLLPPQTDIVLYSNVSIYDLLNNHFDFMDDR